MAVVTPLIKKALLGGDHLLDSGLSFIYIDASLAGCSCTSDDHLQDQGWNSLHKSAFKSSHPILLSIK